MSNDKTLATAKHGGCVQLGDALHEAVGRLFGCDGSPWRTRDVAAALRDYAALSAQPDLTDESPDVASWSKGYDSGYARAVSDLAARQPVGEHPMEMRICELRHVSLKPNRPYVFTVDANCAKCRADAVYALGHTDTKPAQAVELGPVPLIARALAEWHEDDGNVLWWSWCGRDWAGEPAWAGTPNDSDWPGYHTHWTPHPSQPALLDSEAVGNG